MKVTVLTADSGQADSATGKTHALGIGWTTIAAPTLTPTAVVVIVAFDNQEEASGSHEVVLSLLDEGGRPFSTADSGGPLVLTTTLSLTPKPETKPEWPSVASFVVNIGPGIPLEANQRYTWRASVDGKTDDAWTAVFVTREQILD